jgi:hypothetical protein
VEPSVTDQNAYLESLDTAFWMAVAAENPELAARFFLHMIYAGQPALAARSAYYIRNESLLIIVALLALSDAFHPEEVRWTRQGSPLEIGIEALGGVKGEMKPIAKKILNYLVTALPKIYAKDLALGPPLETSESVIARWIKSARLYAEEKSPAIPENSFMLNLHSVRLGTLPPANVFEFVTTMGQNDPQILAAYQRSRRTTSPEVLQDYATRGRAAIWEESTDPSFKSAAFHFSQLALDPQLLLKLIDEDLHHGHGESAFQIVRILALIEESRGP